ncbi:hypothetical protein [Deinococcus sp. Leaf326]|uniref:hypothetical protein n=1 Tax=Deinococcus sp. Leaf326 TaxID=1736338 RepID=UPI0006F7B400|nr:hypothetical protein [Deinococcus sp. Leaf326]KQR17921.1 hypothetical protein ASF71_20250 [Deinococcus sp. Leaf326]
MTIAQLPLLPLYILGALQQGPRTSLELYREVPFPVAFPQLRAILDHLQQAFLVRTIGTLRQTQYELCPQTIPCADGYTEEQFTLVLELLNLYRTELELSRVTRLERTCVHQILAAALQQHLVEMTCVGNLQIYTKHVTTRTGHTI